MLSLHTRFFEDQKNSFSMNHILGSSPVRFPWTVSSSYPSASSSQLDFLEYLGLVKPKPSQSKTRSCFVRILGSKCSICKREFKCKTDTQKHVQKKHRYLKRKTDDKLIRVKLKLGQETFCVNKIDKKYLVPPDQKLDRPLPDCKVPDKMEDQKRVEVSKINHRAHINVPEEISKVLISKGSVSLTSALKDIISLEANASYKNDHVYKDESKKSLNSKDKENIPIPSTSETSSNRRSPAPRSTDLTSNKNGPSFLTPSREPPSPAPSSLGSDTILYVSDCEMDLSELYEDVKQPFSKIELGDDSDDGEIQIIKAYYKNDFHSVRNVIEQTEGSEAAFNMGTIMRVNITEMKQEPLKMEPNSESMDFIELDTSDIDDAETVILPNERGDTELDIHLADLKDDDTLDEFQLQPEDTFMLTVEDQRHNLEGLEEGDQDICILENFEQQLPKPQLEDYFEDAVLKYMEECEAASKDIFNSKNNKDNIFIFGTNLQDKKTRIANLKNSPAYNQHLKNALMRLGITVTPPSLFNKVPDFH